MVQVCFSVQGKISNEPRSRITPITQSVLDRNNYVFDAHCHIFDSHCIDAKYLAVRMLAGVPEMLKPKLWKVITGQTMSRQMKLISKEELLETLYEQPNEVLATQNADQLIPLMELNLNSLEAEFMAADKVALTQLGLSEWLVRVKYILKLLGSTNMESVYQIFHDDYGIHKIIGELESKTYELITIVLGMDLNMGWDNANIKKSQGVQNSELTALARKHSILPFLPIDPRRADMGNLQDAENLYRIFIDAFKVGNPSFFGVKVYPALGYLPCDSRLQPIFQICAEKNIPVMTHCGGESVSTFTYPIAVNREGAAESISIKPRAARARFLNEPGEWISVLTRHPDLKLCFGHFGSGKAWSEPGGVRSKRIQIILDLMKEYKVYSDFSYNLESPVAVAKFLEKIYAVNVEGELMRSRVLYGTDFWVVLPSSNLNLDQRTYINKLWDLKNNLLKDNVLEFLGLK